MPAGRYPRCADTLCRERAAKLRRHRCWSSASAPGSKTQAFASTETCLGASPSRRQLARLHDPRSADTEWIPRRSHHSTETRFGGASRARCDDNSCVCCRDPRGAHTKSRALAPRRSHSRHRKRGLGTGSHVSTEAERVHVEPTSGCFRALGRTLRHFLSGLSRAAAPESSDGSVSFNGKSGTVHCRGSKRQGGLVCGELGRCRSSVNAHL